MLKMFIDELDSHTVKSMIHEIGLITKTTSKAQEIISTITIQFNELFEYITIKPILNNKVAYLIWQKPYISIGADTFISDMLSRCSLEPVFNNHSRYPEITQNELSEKNIDLIFLSSEPFPFNSTHKNEMEHLFPDKKIILVDGEYFSWYGSRLKMAPKYFQTLLTSIND